MHIKPSLAYSPRPALPPGRGCRVVIVEDHTAVLEMTRQVVESIEGYRVVGHARDAASAREVCGREQPDLIVLDLLVPQAVGFELLDDLRAMCPRGRVVIFSGHLRPSLVREALFSGAHGLVEKTASLDEFRHALKAVGAGQIYFSRATSETIRRIVNRDPDHRPGVAKLTERERAILRSIAEGMSSKEISVRLGISRHTVINHRTRLAKKTGLSGTAQLARYAVQLGLVADVIVA